MHVCVCVRVMSTYCNHSCIDIIGSITSRLSSNVEVVGRVWIGQKIDTKHKSKAKAHKHEIHILSFEVMHSTYIDTHIYIQITVCHSQGHLSL